ncbi:MAG: PKD domain-containing protein [Bacteroidetes bacterium]|nr:MAG: PKD domain-containing protein [Bacteroidota bacterium]
MKNSDNIEKLFKDTFEHFEADVNPKIWTNIQSGVNPIAIGSVSGSAASVAAKFAVGKIVAGIVSVGLISGSILYFSSSNDKISSSDSEKKHHAEAVTQGESSQNIISEQQSPERVSEPNTTNWQAPPAARTLNQYSSDNDGQTQMAGGKNDNTGTSDESTSDNAAASQPAHKYGNAPKGDGGMIRGTQNAYSASSSAYSAGSSADTEEEGPDYPTAAIFANTTSGDAPLTVDFITQGIASSLNWDFGDGSGSKEISPSHTFNKPGNYVVRLTAKNPAGGNATDRVTIEVKAVSSVTNIPNIFTPNGDGENDFFFFEMKNIASVGVAIYSTADSKQICTWNSIDGKWNGKLTNGQNAPEGVYLYSIQANGSDGVIHTKKGFVTLSIKR